MFPFEVLLVMSVFHVFHVPHRRLPPEPNLPKRPWTSADVLYWAMLLPVLVMMLSMLVMCLMMAYLVHQIYTPDMCPA